MLGFTGVLWYPRGAAANSMALESGAGPVPLGVASGAWTDLAVSLGEAEVQVGAVMAELGVAWEGLAAGVALSKFGMFGGWLGATTAHAAEMALATGAGSAAYTVAAAIMPSMLEIAATEAAVTAGEVAASAAGPATLGASLAGAHATAEAAQQEMDIRAAIAMEGYEFASTVLAFPVPFTPAPPIAGWDLESAFGDMVALNPVAAAQNLATQAAASAGNPLAELPAGAVQQAASVAGSAVSTATSAASSAGQLAAGAGVGAVGGAPLMSAVSESGMSVGGELASGALGAASAGPMAGGDLGIPAGWAIGSPVGGAAPAPVAPGSAAAEARPVAEPAPRPTAGSGLAGGRGAAGAGRDEDDERETPEFLKNFEHFADGRVVVPAVIGAPDPDGR